MIRVLLTGAGFTHQFGAPLTTEFWYSLFNNRIIQEHDELRRRLLYNTDFESVYQDIISSNLDHNLQSKFNSVLLDTYKILDETIREVTANKSFKDFLLIWLNGDAKSIFFTLNQDLYIERNYYELIQEGSDSSLLLQFKELKIKKQEPVKISRLGLPNDNIKAQYQPFPNEWRVYLDGIDIPNTRNSLIHGQMKRIQNFVIT